MTAKLLMTADDMNRHPARWAEARRAGVGSSDIAVIIGVAPESHGSVFSLFVEKKTGENIGRDSGEAARGRALEPYVAEDLASMRRDLVVLDGGMYAAEDCPWMTATFDRLVVRRDALPGGKLPEIHPTFNAGNPEMYPEYTREMTPAELKTALSRNDAEGRQVWGEAGTDEVPSWYRAQAYWQMAVWGTDTVYMPMKLMGNWETTLYVIRRTADVESDINWMTERAAEFMQRLADDVPPPLDWSPASGRALRTLNPVEPGTVYRCLKRDADRVRAAYQAMKIAERKYGLAQNLVARKAGGAARIVTADPERPGKDVTVMDRRTSGQERVDIDRLRSERPAIAADYTRTVPVDAWYPGQRWMWLNRAKPVVQEKNPSPEGK